MNYSNNHNVIERQIDGLNWVVKASELEGLEGDLKPYGLTDRVKINVLHVVDKVVVETEIDQVVLNPDDSFVLQNSGHIRLIKGPSRYENVFEKVVAETRLGVYKHLVFKNDPIWLSYSQRAIALNVGTTEKINGGKAVSGRSVLVIENIHSGMIGKIVVRAFANKEATTWLANILYGANLEQQPSGIFEVYHKDLEKTKWIEEQVEIDRPGLEANKDFWGKVRQLQNINEPRAIQVNGKMYTLNNRNIYRGTVAGGKKVDLRTLYDKGVLDEIISRI